MTFFKTTLDCYVKRPFMIIYIAVISLLYAVIQIFNPVIGLLQNLGAIRSDNWTDSMIYISKELYVLSNLSYFIPIIALGCLIIAILSGTLTSGFMNVYHESFFNKKSGLVEVFFTGVKKATIKISLVFLQFYLLLAAFVILIPIATVPSIILKQKSLENGSANIFTTEVLTVLTIVVLFFILAFIVMAFIFRFPSVFYFKKRPIEKAKNVVSTAFIRYFTVICLLIVLVLGNEFMILGITNKTLEFIVGFLTRVLLLVAISSVSFTGYHMMIRKFRKSVEMS